MSNGSHVLECGSALPLFYYVALYYSKRGLAQPYYFAVTYKKHRRLTRAALQRAVF